jgi:hypothetical protein
VRAAATGHGSESLPLNHDVTHLCRLPEVIFNEHFTSGVDHLSDVPLLGTNGGS